MGIMAAASSRRRSSAISINWLDEDPRDTKRNALGTQRRDSILSPRVLDHRSVSPERSRAIASASAKPREMRQSLVAPDYMQPPSAAPSRRGSMAAAPPADTPYRCGSLRDGPHAPAAAGPSFTAARALSLVRRAAEVSKRVLMEIQSCASPHPQAPHGLFSS